MALGDCWDASGGIICHLFPALYIPCHCTAEALPAKTELSADSNDGGVLGSQEREGEEPKYLQHTMTSIMGA
ncbi:hypothetical protein NQZ68_016200 [Dissostichus eleginoides]|nr:hypothetical protein NQZ68_016200 [Dissostichus eleginoides]